MAPTAQFELRIPSSTLFLHQHEVIFTKDLEMDFELRRAREKLEREQKERKEKAKFKVEKERKAKEEAKKQREAIEAAQRSRRIDAAEAQLKVIAYCPIYIFQIPCTFTIVL